MNGRRVAETIALLGLGFSGFHLYAYEAMPHPNYLMLVPFSMVASVLVWGSGK